MSQLTIFQSCRDVSYTGPVNTCSLSQVHKVVLPIRLEPGPRGGGITAYTLSKRAVRPVWLPL